ncbi:MULTISPECIES: bifunctional 2-polyprenyl-6-hydroxyphenol methylase/3-demethylubiquinol 3-O-methyltransferase UbiG [Haloferax]|uniref:Methyltransferase domain-containing protein n=1 Tax=Haloferax marinum TaxID=2666143 RepID=A0A6A8G595_9EURY|nr:MULTISPECIES: class I SAM-dependent methyltransferase [Haloferax]KAB1197293.1 methyltransferase domain-containing protein [Haloferax sp. CBA1150]MRW96334.1 methyltransferase domain-containing protein [Haloferax marinum]
MPTRDRSHSSVESLALLWAARESGVIDALTSTAGTAEAVADVADIDLRAARITVEALASMGFIKRVGDEYEITNRALGFLAKRDVRSIGRLPHALDYFSLYTDLPETMANGVAPDLPDEWVRNRLGAEDATDESVVRACVTAAVRESPDATRVLELAGGSGVFARELLERGFDVSYVDEAETVEVVRPLLSRAGVDLVAGDPTNPPVTGFDLVFVGDAFDGRNPDEAAALVTGAFDALAPGGTAVFVDTLHGRCSTDATTSRAVDALARGRGDLYDESTVRSWVDSAGFARETVRNVPGTDLQAVVAERAVD